jgi:DNA adenine methylase
MLNAPIKYYGGKSGMVNQILKWFPKDYKTYCEPFGGSYSIGFNQSCHNEIYNDLEKNVYSLFKVLSDKELFSQFKELVDLTYYSEDIRKEFKNKLKDDISIVDRAYYFYTVNRMSMNGIGGMSVNLCERRHMSKSVSDYLSSCDRLLDLHHRLSTVIIKNRDAIEILKFYDSKDMMYYEWSTRGTSRYLQDMDNNKQIEYVNTLITLKSKCLVSGYKCKLYETLENNGFKRIDFEVNTVNTGNSPKTKIESLWMNYTVKNYLF